MRNRRVGLLLLTTLVVGARMFAQALTPTESVAPNGVSNSLPPSSMTVSMRGTILRYDASTRTVTLSTTKGPMPFALGALARIRRDGQVVAASSLQTLLGYRAVVRYSQTESAKTVESIHIFGTSKR